MGLQFAEIFIDLRLNGGIEKDWVSLKVRGPTALQGPVLRPWQKIAVLVFLTFLNTLIAPKQTT